MFVPAQISQILGEGRPALQDKRRHYKSSVSKRPPRPTNLCLPAKRSIHARCQRLRPRFAHFSVQASPHISSTRAATSEHSLALAAFVPSTASGQVRHSNEHAPRPRLASPSESRHTCHSHRSVPDNNLSQDHQPIIEMTISPTQT
jgi:hypothetical protein